MGRYSKAVQANVRRRMSPPNRQSVVQISQELGIHMATLYNWRKIWHWGGGPNRSAQAKGYAVQSGFRADHSSPPPSSSDSKNNIGTTNSG